MRILYFGNGERGEVCLRAIVDSGAHVVGVVGHPGPRTPVTRLGESMGFPVFQPERVNRPSFIEQMRLLNPGLGILAGYNQILRRKILTIPTGGFINLHGGPLPAYRGVAPLNWQIINGETKGGCSIIYVDEGIDTGDIVAEATYPINGNDDAASILRKLVAIFPPLLVKALSEISAGKIERIPQDPEAGCYYTRRYPRDGRIDWRVMKAEQVHNLVRALVDPYPGAFTYRGTTKIRIQKTSMLSREIRGIPGRLPLKDPNGVVAIAADRGLLIRTISVGDSPEFLCPRFYFDIGDELT
jgi:methionyl-tRNA formyltransferase